MCAISGMISFSGDTSKIKEEHRKKILLSMKRRGPDQNGIYETEDCILFHSRLSVIDPENGIQPMTVEKDGVKYTIVYNGEIYNCGELKKKLEGEDFDTSCDTEVVLRLFIKYGEKSVSMLNGIFAYAIWDEKRRQLFAARDCIGVKPFFFTEKDGSFIFSSEIKTLFEYPEVRPVIDMTSVSELMLIGPGRTPGYGVFCGIKELEPGQCGYVTQSENSFYSYHRLYDEPFGDSFEEAVKKVRELVIDSIECQLVSDVPIGAFLSGGLDSSLICSVAADKFRKEGKKLTAFSVYYKDNEKYFKAGKFQPNSDNEYIDIMVKYLDCRHERVVIDTEELADALFEAVDARDLPGMADVDSSLLCFCREVKKNCTVVLSGECADEIFGGYPWFRDRSVSRKKGFPWAQTTDWRAGFLKKELSDKIDVDGYVDGKYSETIKNAPVIADCGDDNRHTKLMMYLNMKWFMQTLLDNKDIKENKILTTQNPMRDNDVRF